MRPTVALLLTLLPLPGCRTESPAVTGTATYQERIALPKDAAFEAALVTSTRRGARHVSAWSPTGGPASADPLPHPVRPRPHRLEPSVRDPRPAHWRRARPVPDRSGVSRLTTAPAARCSSRSPR
jgi:hypothetical protein